MGFFVFLFFLKGGLEIQCILNGMYFQCILLHFYPLQGAGIYLSVRPTNLLRLTSAPPLRFYNKRDGYGKNM